MSKMSNDDYKYFKEMVYRMVYEIRCEKYELQAFYDTKIKYRYFDWHDSLVMIDKCQSKWTMDLE